MKVLLHIILALFTSGTVLAQQFPNPLANKKLYLNKENTASLWLRENKRAPEAKAIEQIALMPQAIWLNDTKAPQIVRQHLSKASLTLPVFVLYAIPNRDKGQHSAGGVTTQDEYQKLVTQITQAIGSKEAVIILEPDALSLLGDAETFATITSAVSILKKNPRTYVYIDAGHSNWHSANETSKRLLQSNIAKADGFSLNTSNFRATDELIMFGTNVSSLVQGKHFVIDTSRNGNGPFVGDGNAAWCNPPGRALGQLPTTKTNHPLVDAFLWIKCPGESDGPENGAPSAGTFWPRYASELVSNRTK